MRTIANNTPSIAPRQLAGRILWPIGWVVLLIVSTSITYALLVVGGK